MSAGTPDVRFGDQMSWTESLDMDEILRLIRSQELLGMPIF
jgi:hypothetical protein